MIVSAPLSKTYRCMPRRTRVWFVLRSEPGSGLRGQVHRHLTATASALLCTGVLTLRGTPGERGQLGGHGELDDRVHVAVKYQPAVGPLWVAAHKHPTRQLQLRV